MQYATAQPKISTTPQVGNIITTEYSYTTGVTQGAMGANKMWDYSTLQDSAFSSTIKIVDAVGTPYVADFPGAQYAGSIGDTLYSYFKKEAGNPAILGLESSLSKFEYLHPLVTLRYPFTYLDLFETSDTMYIVTPIKTTSKLLDTLLVSGYGTLKMPEKTYNNVLQVRHINSSTGSITIPGGDIITLPPSVDTTFDYYANGQPSPILSYSIYKGKIQLITYLKSSGLPLHFISFTAVADSGKIKLNWETGNESNTDVFRIQRSTDGNNFGIVGHVSAIGNGGHKYHYTDNINQTDVQELYYRLQETDKDGRSIYSDIVICKLPDYARLILFPNPATNNITITGIGNFSSLRIYNMDGQQLKYVSLQDESITLPVSDLLPGVYIAELSKGRNMTRLKFLKK